MKKTISVLLLALLQVGLFASSFSIQKAKAGTSTITVPDKFPTIQAAINAANPGDTVYVRAGTYHEELVVNKMLSLVGESPQNTTITAGYAGTVVDVVADGVNVTAFTISFGGNGYTAAGIDLENVSHCNIIGNVITNSRFGVWLHNSSNDSLTRNNVTSNTTYGVWLDSSSNNSLVGNNLSNNFDGVQLDNASGNTLRDNHINSAERNFGVDGFNLTDFFNDVDASNTVGGQSVCYWVNRKHEVVPANSGYVVIVNSTDITIENLNLGGNEQGILLVCTENSTITGNVIQSNWYGIYSLLSSNNNHILRNTIAYNHESGVAFVSSSNNSIYLNNFIDNAPVYVSSDSVNTWDNGTHGNYWIFSAIHDDTQVDVTLATLLNASEVDSSGIWNVSYVIDANNVDHYPLVNQVTIPEFSSPVILLVGMLSCFAAVIAFCRKHLACSRLRDKKIPHLGTAKGKRSCSIVGSLAKSQTTLGSLPLIYSLMFFHVLLYIGKGFFHQGNNRKKFS